MTPPASSKVPALQPIAHTLHAVLHKVLPRLPVCVSSRVYGALFLLNQGLAIPVAPPRQKSTTRLRISSTQSLDTHIFCTPNVRPARTILIVHGLAATAHNDPRIISLANALASASPANLVLVPHLPPLADCDLSAEPVALVSSVIAAVAADPFLCPSGRLSLASACISAGFSLVAATHHPHAIHAIFTIGTHASVSTVLDHAVARKGRDDSIYAVNSVIGSFMSPRTVVADMLVAYVIDDHLRNVDLPAPFLQALLDKHPEEAKEYHRIREDSEYMTGVLRKVYRDNELVMEGMSPMRFLDALKCETVALVHARQDDIVPYTESVMLADALRKRDDVFSALCVTDLLNHGDQRDPSLADVPGILQLVSTFAAFFRPDSSSIDQKDKSE